MVTVDVSEVVTVVVVDFVDVVVVVVVVGDVDVVVTVEVVVVVVGDVDVVVTVEVVVVGFVDVVVTVEVVVVVAGAHVPDRTKSSPSAAVLSLASSVPASPTYAQSRVAPAADVTSMPLPLCTIVPPVPSDPSKTVWNRLASVNLNSSGFELSVCGLTKCQ